MRALEGKIALITGGTRGIGLETVKLFVEEGAFVFFTGTSSESVKKASDLLKSSNVQGIVADVSKDTDVDKTYAVIKETKGSVDIIIANAGVLGDVPVFTNASSEAISRLLDVNVKGVVFTVNRAVSTNLLNDGGSIVLLSSIVADSPLGGEGGVYAATKGAVNTLAKGYARDLAPKKVRVNSLSPGPINTDMFKSFAVNDEIRDQLSNMVLLKRIADPKEIATATLFLASDAASYVNATQLHVDGGF